MSEATDRRRHPRTSGENAATGIVQAMIRAPGEAAKMVEQDLKAGADPQVVLGLLDAVASILEIRGLDRSTHLAALRHRVTRPSL